MSQTTEAATSQAATEPSLVTPGTQRTISFSIAGHNFVFRRPSRQDQAEAAARTALRLQMGGAPDQQSWTNWLNFLDGYRLQWEARLEIGLRPARGRSGQVLNLGERAPAHWLEDVRDVQGQVVDQVVSFAAVDPDEFDAVVAYLETALKKKDGLPTPSSGVSATGTTSG